MNWNRFSLFKLPNHHRTFNFVPRYYDERKERTKRKMEEYKRMAANQSESEYEQKRREINFRSETQSKWGNSEFKSQSMRANVRLIIILGIVLFGFYYLFVALDLLGPFIDSISK